MESLIAMQLVLLNEDKETFEISSSHHIRGCSHLNISRNLSVYQSSLLRLLDVQICPLLMALKSKVLTLENERETLLRELASLSEDKKSDIIGIEAIDIEIKDLSSQCSVKEESEKTLKALETTIPKWTRSSSALRTAFAGMTVEVVSAEHQDNMTETSSAFRRGDRMSSELGARKYRQSLRLLPLGHSSLNLMKPKLRKNHEDFPQSTRYWR